MERAKEFEKYVDGKVSRGQTIVLLVGSTGCGKTAVAALLDGKKLDVKEDGLFRRLEFLGSGIAHGPKLGTKSPVIHEIGEGILLCDRPGFQDTHGPETELH